MIKVAKIPYYVHRLAYIEAHGNIPSGFFVCHTCDQRLCIEPTHLYAGTAADNNRDCWARGRGFNVGAQEYQCERT